MMNQVILNKKIAKKVAKSLIENNVFVTKFQRKSLEWIVRKDELRAPVYVDCRNLLHSSAAVFEIVDNLYDLLKERMSKYDTIFGLETAGIPYAAMLAYKMGKPFGYIRKRVKRYGVPRLVEGNPPANSSALIIDDTCFTGGTMISAIKALKAERKIETIGAIAIVTMSDYGFNNKWGYFEANNIPLFSLTNYQYLQQEALDKGLISAEENSQLNEYYKDPLNYRWKTK